MTIQVSPNQAEQWIRTRDRATGRQLAVAVPSASTPNLWHLVNLAGCDCRGFAYRQTCRHFRAVQAEAIQRAQPKRRTLCAGCNGTSAYHMAHGRGVKVPLLGRVCA